MRVSRLLATPFNWQWLVAAVVLIALCVASAVLPFVLGGWGQ